MVCFHDLLTYAVNLSWWTVKWNGVIVFVVWNRLLFVLGGKRNYSNAKKKRGKSPEEKIFSLIEVWQPQWRIQDFPGGGATPEVGAPTYYLANFSRKLHEILGPRGGACVPSQSIVDPPQNRVLMQDTRARARSHTQAGLPRHRENREFESPFSRQGKHRESANK